MPVFGGDRVTESRQGTDNTLLYVLVGQATKSITIRRCTIGYFIYLAAEKFRLLNDVSPLFNIPSSDFELSRLILTQASGSLDYPNGNLIATCQVQVYP